MALRRVADKTEAQLDELVRRRVIADEPAWAATAAERVMVALERVMVAFDARPHARQLIRDAWRLAHGLRAPLLAVTVVPRRPGSGTPATSDPIVEFSLLAEDLGAEVIRIEGRNVAEELARVARERHVTQIVIGQPERIRRFEVLRGSVVNRLPRLSIGADIHVVPHHRHRD